MQGPHTVSNFHCHDCDEPVSQVPCLLCLTPVDGSNCRNTMKLIFCKQCFLVLKKLETASDKCFQAWQKTK